MKEYYVEIGPTWEVYYMREDGQLRKAYIAGSSSEANTVRDALIKKGAEGVRVHHREPVIFT